MTCKTIEIYYDIRSIPAFQASGKASAALDFRNKAMDLIEIALMAAGVGESIGAEITSNEVNFGFEVTDYDQAEAIVRHTVDGTEFANIRQIVRAEVDESVLEDEDEDVDEDEEEDEDEDDFEDDDWEGVDLDILKLIAGGPYADEENEEEDEDDEDDDDDYEYDEDDDDELSGAFEDESFDRIALAERLSESGYQDSHLLAMAALECHRLVPTELANEDQLEPEARSHLGGNPEVPEDFEWPRRNGRPLAFIAQVDYAEEGVMLLFFYDLMEMPSGHSPDHRGSCRVLEVSRDKLARAIPPDDLPPEFRFREKPVTMISDVNFPDATSQLLDHIGVGESDRKLLKLVSAMNAERNPPAHYLLGHPATLDGDMETICQQANGGDKASPSVNSILPGLEMLVGDWSQWMLLFQCDADPDVGWTFGNSGRLYFWITVFDFNESNYDNVWAIVQNKPTR